MTDQRLAIATLKLFVKSREPPISDQTVFYLEKLKDLTRVQEYAVRISNRFGMLDALENPEEMWDTFKRQTLETAKEYIGEHLRSRSGFASVESRDSIEESHGARLAGRHDQGSVM